ncbi:hypothetical protein NQ318_018996 [Aromia moschata]|uniref:Uncharacterized protein n=1 Tax=Aromia moschata TaxID=1265417 RepID=A0AAV8YE91_9CUCU|nr:hypothetical protein NQ318_018996 [Aromia moschata]
MEEEQETERFVEIKTFPDINFLRASKQLEQSLICEKCCNSLLNKIEQRFNLKFFVKLGKTFTGAYAMLKEVYGNECLSRTQFFELFKWFKEGHETTESDPRPGRPSTSKNGRKH